jgi:hypothetical protein
VSFPTTPLVVKIEFAFGADLTANPATWTYQDRTADWLADRDLAATVGRADATSKAQPGSLSFWLKNPTGDYTKGNPFSQFWPYVRKNTPCRVTLDPGTGHTRQYVMYVTKWLPRWTDQSGGQPLVQVVAAGVRRRLSQGDSPLRSPLYRAITALTPLAHWSFEDGTNATQVGSAVNGGQPLTLTNGQIKFGVDGPGGAVQAAEITNCHLIGSIPNGSNPNGWGMFFAFRATRPVGTSADVTPLFQWRAADGDTWYVEIFNNNSGSAHVNVTSFNSPVQNITNMDPYDGKWHSLLVLYTKTSGTTVQLDTYVDGVHITNTGTFTFAPLGGVVQGPGDFLFLGTDSLQVSHLGFFETTVAPTQLAAATLGYAGETVHDRVVRLCGELGVAATVSANAATPMGVQKPNPFLTLLDDCQNTDGGILLDGLNAGFTYLARADAYNLPVAVTLDMAARQARGWEPQDDDVGLVNSETITRDGGSSATYTDVGGDSGTTAIALYDDEQTLNLASDGDLAEHAAWRVHVGTAGGDALRFPTAGFDLHLSQSTALIEPWLQAGVRTRLQVVNPPAEYGPGPVDLLVEGYTETVRSRRVWQVDPNCSPYDPWRVFVIGDALLGLIDTAGSTVHATVAAGSSSLQVDVTGPLWVTGAVSLDMWIDGIKVRVTNIAGAASPQTFTVTAATVTKQLVVGRRVRLWQPAAIAL